MKCFYFIFFKWKVNAFNTPSNGEPSKEALFSFPGVTHRQLRQEGSHVSCLRLLEGQAAGHSRSSTLLLIFPKSMWHLTSNTTSQRRRSHTLSRVPGRSVQERWRGSHKGRKSTLSHHLSAQPSGHHASVSSHLWAAMLVPEHGGPGEVQRALSWSF